MTLYIGMRVELSNRTQKLKNLTNTYNDSNNQFRIFDVHDNGRIVIEKINEMIVARGKQEEKIHTGLINFSLMTPLEIEIKEVERIIKIVNVLGNDRLIRERVKTFTTGQSALNKIPEFNILVKSFQEINKLIPGFVEVAWYYAPEIKFK